VPLAELREGLRPVTDVGPDPVADGGRELPTADRAGLGEQVTPRTELECQLTTVWSEVLGVQGIGAHDDFFALGGNSMVAVQLVWRVGQVTGEKLTMRMLYDAPTVAGMAASLAGVRSSTVPTAAGEREIPLLPRGRS
jgi:phthiocerol/phenolphthiocerol synthesis type-I polyketide synthase E